MSEALLEVRGLQKFFPITRGFFQRVVGHVRAVDGVDFTLKEGETLVTEHVRHGTENRLVRIEGWTFTGATEH